MQERDTDAKKEFDTDKTRARRNPEIQAKYQMWTVKVTNIRK